MAAEFDSYCVCAQEFTRMALTQVGKRFARARTLWLVTCFLRSDLRQS